FVTHAQVEGQSRARAKIVLQVESPVTLPKPAQIVAQSDAGRSEAAREHVGERVGCVNRIFVVCAAVVGAAQLKTRAPGMPAAVVAKIVENGPTAAIGVQQLLPGRGQESAQAADLLRHKGLRCPRNVLLVDSGAKFIEAGGRQNPVPREGAGAILCRIL